ncbi:MAG: hypothetical protein P1U36_10320 [Legionellaceae bacterium]|nr:hypothetical protein [Legionellaceae bacterium]
MAIKSLDDWSKAWDDALGGPEERAYDLLKQYVDDSQEGVAGTLSPMTWFAVSNKRNVQYLSAESIENALEHTYSIRNLESFLRCLKQNIDSFYRKRFSELDEVSTICEGDELLHVLQVIKEKTSVDYFAIDMALGKGSNCSC